MEKTSQLTSCQHEIPAGLLAVISLYVLESAVTRLADNSFNSNLIYFTYDL